MGEAARHAHGGAGHGDRRDLVDRVPRDALDGAGHVAELELEERLAVLLLAAGDLAHLEHRVDGLAVGQVAHEVLGADELWLVHGGHEGRGSRGRDTVPDMGVLVAGGTGALGEAVVRDLRDAGYEVTVADRRGEPPVDLLDTAAAAEAVGSVADLEAVVNLVGGFAMGPKVEEAELEDFERMLRLNLVPAFNLARAAMPAMASRGRARSCACPRARRFSRSPGPPATSPRRPRCWRSSRRSTPSTWRGRAQ